jgi:hypothetical protein
MELAHVRESLSAHVAAKGAALRAKYGPDIDWREMLLILQDPSLVRYPCGIVFDDEELLPGECAHPAPRSERPEEGFILYVHPYFTTRRSLAAYPLLYQLVSVNYGDFASAEDAETFGAAALGISKDDYYHVLCEMSDIVTRWNVDETALVA